MEISVRSYLTAGMAAVVGATAIGLAPTLPAPDLRAAALPAPVVAEITLTGTSLPLQTIATVVKALSSGGSLQAGVTSLISSIGTEVAKEIMPLVTSIAGDVVKYVGTSLFDLFTGPGAPQLDLQAILATATAAMTSGSLSGALTALTSGLSVPLSQISKVLFTPEFQTFIIGKVGTVLGALPEILRTAVQKVVGIDIKPLIDLVSGLLTKFVPGVVPPAAALAAPRALAAAAAPVAALTTVTPEAVADAPVSAAPEAAPAVAAEGSAKTASESAPAAEAAPESDPATPATEVTEAAPESAPAAEAPEVAAAPEVTPAPEVAAPETVAPVEASPATVAEAPAPAVTRAAKPGPRHSAAAKSAAARSSSARG